MPDKHIMMSERLHINKVDYYYFWQTASSPRVHVVSGIGTLRVMTQGLLMTCSIQSVSLVMRV